MDPRLVILGLAALLLVLAVVHLIASVASARRGRRKRSGRPAGADIAPVAVSDAPIELGEWAPSSEPDEHGLRIGADFEDIAPGTVHGQDRPTHHEVVDVEPGASLLSIEELIRRHAQTPVPERAPMPGAPIETLLYPRVAEAASVAEPVGPPADHAPEPLETPSASVETPTTAYAAPDHEGSGSIGAVAASFGSSVAAGPAPTEAPAPAAEVRPAPPAPVSPAPAAIPALDPVAAPWFTEAATPAPHETAPGPPTAPEPAADLAAPPAAPPASVEASVAELDELIDSLEPVSSGVPAEEAVAVAAPEPEPDPRLLLEPLLAEPAPAVAGAARPTARDARQVPAYHMVAPIELWFADGPPRVGIRPGTPTYLKYQRLAQVLINDLKKAHGRG